MIRAALWQNRRELGEHLGLAHNHAARAVSAALRSSLLLVKRLGLALAHLADKTIEQVFEPYAGGGRRLAPRIDYAPRMPSTEEHVIDSAIEAVDRARAAARCPAG